MILKVYIKKELFHLPRKQDDLTEMIKEKFYERKKLEKSGIAKLYPISDIESKIIKYEKNVNIFLINLFFQVLQHNEELESDKDIKITLSDKKILEEISKKIDVNLKGLSIEEIEEKTYNYISNKQNNKDVSKKIDTESNGQNVEFSLSWVKAMDKKIKE